MWAIIHNIIKFGSVVDTIVVLYRKRDTMEKIPIQSESLYVFPMIEREIGEIERVAQLFAPNTQEEFIQKFISHAHSTHITLFDEDSWKILENSDSFGISVHDWAEVAHHAVQGHTDHPRDWKDIKEKLEKGIAVDAPIILKRGGVFHLVSGNTRLMVARALGIKPAVLIVTMD